HQWTPKAGQGAPEAPEAHGSGTQALMMTTADMAMKMDPDYHAISKRFHENPDQFGDAFARAWYKLTHRDMGPVDRYLGPDVPREELIWQDPVPAPSGAPLTAAQIDSLKDKLLNSGLSRAQLVRTAWASASTFRNTDKRGGANGARIRLAPQKDWEINQPNELAGILDTVEQIQQDFEGDVSLADLIVLGGTAAVEQAAKEAGYSVEVPFQQGRTDASDAQTDAASFDVLEPKADAFRNYFRDGEGLPPEERMVDKAHLLSLSAPEMAVLVAGLRVLDANADGSPHGVFTQTPGRLTNDFFVNLLDMGTEWSPVSAAKDIFEGRDRASGQVKWKGTRVDLVFGSNSQLRAIAEVYAQDGAEAKFVGDFIKAWTKVMTLDRYDVN
ncbi:MAG: peroxidase family protein, partial [Pseudomonadota bacterium]